MFFWSKSKPAAVVPPTPYDPSTLEKGKETDRRSSFSSANSSSQQSSPVSPVKSFPLPQQPQTAYAPPNSHSQTLSMHEHSSGEESFRVLPTDGHRRRATRRVLTRYWFIIAIALLATVTIIGAIVGIMNIRHTTAATFFSPEQISAGVATASSYIIIDHGTIISTFVAGATPTPTAS